MSNQDQMEHESEHNLSIEQLKFDNSTLRRLRIDKVKENYNRQATGANFSLVSPAPVKNPQLVCHSHTALGLLGLSKEKIEEEIKNPLFAQYFSGNLLLPGAQSAAHCYCGHQFGYFSGQLGDGAAMYLGEVINPKNERWEIQFKGAGQTPYSRAGDGRKVLRSSVREFLCSEAMHFLGVPTTRAGTVVTSDTVVDRDIFYTGNVVKERCTIVLRIAQTFIRFGSFEIFKDVDRMTGREGPSVGMEAEMLPEMLDFVIENYFPDIWNSHKGGVGDDQSLEPKNKSIVSYNKQLMYKEFYGEVVLRTARLAAEWQCVGFCHGVLNTDNMSIVGVTIDYGPYGFMEFFDPKYICNHSDEEGRYNYENQVEICKWNCQKLAEAISKALPNKMAYEELAKYDDAYFSHYENKLRQKLGLINNSAPTDKELFESFFQTMADTKADFTCSFRALSKFDPFTNNKEEMVAELVSYTMSFGHLQKSSRPTMPLHKLEQLEELARKDPHILALFGMKPGKIQAELEKFRRFRELDEGSVETKKAKDKELWSAWVQKYQARIMDDYNSNRDHEDQQTYQQKRVTVMNKSNPRYVLRNYVAQKAIEQAEKGDFSMVRRVLALLSSPFEDHSPEDVTLFGYPPDEKDMGICVSCSS